MTRHQRHLRHLLGLASAGAIVLAGTSLVGAAGLWSSPEMVGPDDDSGSTFPNVEVSPDGTVWIVWSAEDPVEADEEVYCVRIEDFVQSPRERIHEDNTAMDRCPLMSMGADGLPWIVWERYSSALGYVQVVSHWTGSSWAPPDTVFRHGARWDNYAIHASSNDDVWVAKSSVADGRSYRDIFLRHWDGDGWGLVETVGFDNWEDTDPALTTDGDGRPWVAWTRFDLSRLYRNFICGAVRGDEGWSEPALVDTGDGNLGVCDLGAVSDGSPMVVWASAGAAPCPDLDYAVFGTGGWEYKGRVNKPDDPATDSDTSARLAVGVNGDSWAVWTSSVWGESRQAITASRCLGDGWSEEELVSAPDTASLREDMNPDVAVAEDGRVWAVWRRRQEATPRDMDIYVACREVYTPVDVWSFTAQAEGGGVNLLWMASPDAARNGFRVWRSEGEGCAGQTAGIPSDAVCLSDVAIRDCTACGFTDDTTPPPGTYCYWLERLGGGAFGPAVAVVPQAPSASSSFAVYPNPAGRGVAFRLSEAERPCEIRIFTVSGRAVRTLLLSEGATERTRGEAVAVPWDGTDASGSAVPSGVFYAELRERGGRAAIARLRFALVR